MPDAESDPEIDPSWWEPAFIVDDLIEAEWRPPEIVSRHLACLAHEAPPGTLQRNVLAALALASSAMLNPENWDEPFKPMMEIGEQRSTVPPDLTDEQFEVLERALPYIEHVPLRARVADVLWCFHDRSNLDLLRMAVDAYRAVPLEHDHWVHRGDDAWRRAIELTRRRGNGERERLNEIAGALRQRILEGSSDEGFMVIGLSDLLRMCGQQDAESRPRLAAHFADLASSAASAGNLRLARHLERKAQQWFASSEDQQAVNDSVARVVELYEREAEQRLAGPNGSAMAAGLFLEKAISALRSLPRKYRVEQGLESHLTNLRQQLEENREDTLEGMMRIQTDEIDLTDAIADTRRRLSAHSRFDALVYLAASWPLSDPKKERAQAEELARGSLRHLFGGATYSADGRKVASTEGGLAEPDAAIWSDMVRSAGMKRGIVATAFIIPGLDVITFEHRYDQAYLHRLCQESPLVPAGHEDLWARGLRHGLTATFPPPSRYLCRKSNIPSAEFLRVRASTH